MSDIVVSSGQISSGLIISANDMVTVEKGGTAIDTDVLRAGTLLVDKGGIVSFTSLGGPNFGYLLLAPGGTAVSTTVGSGGDAEVSDKGTAFGVTAESGGLLIVTRGGVVTDLTVSSGGTADNSTIVSPGETLSGATIPPGGGVYVEGGGTALDIRLDSAAYIVVSAAGVASGTTALPGTADLAHPSVYVLSYGTAVSSVLGSGAGELVSSGGLAFGAVVESGGFEEVYTGGTALDTQVESGGSFFYFSGSVMSGTDVASGGSVFTNVTVQSGQTVSGLTVGPDTDLTVEASGTALATVVSGGNFLMSGGFASGTVLDSAPEATAGGYYFGGGYYDDGAVALGTVIEALTFVTVSDSVMSGVTLIGSAAELMVRDGGTVLGAVISSGSFEFVTSGGTTSKTDVLSGSELYLTSGGTALDTYVSSGGTLIVSSGAFLAGTEVSSGGTVVGAVPCFAAGTLILTAQGEMPIEHLAVGTWVQLVDGTIEPVIWIGSRTVDCRRHPRPAQVLPVRIRRGAFGPDLPHRHLFLSSDHAIFAEAVLIPVKHLVNGDSIQQVSANTVTYFHVELERHGVIMAEGLPAETYLDTGDRACFDHGVMPLHPAFGSERGDIALIVDAQGYASLRVVGPEVEAAQAKLASRAAPLRAAGGCFADCNPGPETQRVTGPTRYGIRTVTSSQKAG